MHSVVWPHVVSMGATHFPGFPSSTSVAPQTSLLTLAHTKIDLHYFSESTEVQTLHMLASGTQLLVCGIYACYGAKCYQIRNDDWCHYKTKFRRVPPAVVLEAFLQVMRNDVNLSPAFALARSSIHQPTISPDTMDLACHGPSRVNPDAFKSHFLFLFLFIYLIFFFWRGGKGFTLHIVYLFWQSDHCACKSWAYIIVSSIII